LIDKTQCPVFEDHTFENILAWGDAQVLFEGTLNYPAYWREKGFIGFDALQSQEDEAKARKASALFIYLWCKGIPVDLACHLARSYVKVYV